MRTRWRHARPVAALLLAWCLAPAAAAVEIQSIDASRDGERYAVHVIATLDVPAERAFAVMTDYTQLPAINPSIEAVRRLAKSEHGEDIYTEVRLCVALLCKLLWQVQHMQIHEEPGVSTLTAVVDPVLSNLKMGIASWRFAACEPQRTCLEFQVELEPAFWVPPLIGPWIIQRTMRAEALTTSEGIERLAGPMTR